ncbi:MAG: tetratricopeptide repeat protein [Desulfobacterales bacterium]|nr:MAG: tetratricopeptide repeat protein [Desulfobacterales bacterium]
MDAESLIKSLLKEAELYQSQGLLDEAKEKYNNAAALIQKNEQLENRQNLLDTVSEKISALGSDFDRAEKAPKSPDLSPKVQDLIKNLFSFSDDRDEDATQLEGAIALAKFGQFERALAEFNELIKKDSLRVVSAKNILRCHIANGSLDDAIAQYEQWLSSDIVFSSQQLESIRIFLQSILDRKGIHKRLPSVVASAHFEAVIQPTDVDEHEIPEEEEFLDITLIGIRPQRGRLIELDVNFQRGNTVSVIIPGKDKDTINRIQLGLRMDDVECSSAFAVFMASGIVTEKTRIDSGAKRGDYRIDIKIEGA